LLCLLAVLSNILLLVVAVMAGKTTQEEAELVDLEQEPLLQAFSLIPSR
jgi:hypothetical protein